jgi:hypothetical protein
VYVVGVTATFADFAAVVTAKLRGSSWLSSG